MKHPSCTVYLVVHGAVYERYARVLLDDLERQWLPGRTELVCLPGHVAEPPDAWRGHAGSMVSATRYQVALQNRSRLTGEWIFQLDADMRVLKPVGEEVLGDGVVVTVHPGVDGTHPHHWPYERRPESSACVPYGSEGSAYHPGSLVGGRRGDFLELAGEVAGRVRRDVDTGVFACWYEESHLNRVLVERPPALVLDRRYCWWQHWGDSNGEAVVMHLDKTAEEFAQRV